MRRVNCHASAIMELVVAIVVLIAPNVPIIQAASASQVLVRGIGTLDSRGHVGHIFRSGTTVGLRVQWTVQNAPRGARQTIEWTVLYANRVIFHTSRSSTARNGRWSRTARVTIIHNPNLGPHLYRARVTVAGKSSERSVIFTVQR